MVCTLQWVRGLTQLWTENSRWEGVGSCQCSVQLLKALKPLFIFNNICSFLFHLFRSISCVPNGEQYRLLQLLGDISTVQDVHVQMWWSVMCFFPEFKVSFPESQLVITEMKKPSLVLSKAAPALWYKDHHSLQIYTLLPAAPLRIFQTQASGVWSHLLKQCQQNKHQEVKKSFSLWMTAVRKTFWFGLIPALPFPKVPHIAHCFFAGSVQIPSLIPTATFMKG